MYHIYSRKGRNKYNYYLCMNARKRGYKNCPTCLVAAQVIENKFMEFLRKITKDPRIEAKAWDALTLEEKIPILKSIAKIAHYDGNNETLEIVLQKGEISHKFALRLAELKHIPYHRRQAEIGSQPWVRQNLILAHQINQVTKERNCSLRDIAQWVGIVHSRICQIANMLLLSPKIQEEILHSDSKALFNVPEYRLRDITSEIDWSKQQELWDKLLNPDQK